MKKCDYCEKEAKKRCEICDANICNECSKELKVKVIGIKSVYNYDLDIGKIILCCDCQKKADRVNPSSLLKKETKEDILNQLKKNFIIINLKKDEKN